ncbi:WG repeat-containing protein [Ruminococcaceae bacterium OttesenSCG-928-L11]|nr:WG repeat-containing protein [Ruminococcaceae bacterium OttesenSCG-928-L11]
MITAKRLLIIAGCVLLMVVAWIVLITAQTDRERQEINLRDAQAYMEDKVFVKAQPLLETAASLQADQTLKAKLLLKQVYLELQDRNNYTAMLDTLMAEPSLGTEIFWEAAQYYLSTGKYRDALAVLSKGVLQTGDAELEAFYEENRYSYNQAYVRFHEMSEIWQGTVRVTNDGLSGIASLDGELLLPCVYDAVSTMSDGVAVVRSGNEIFAVNRRNQRTALLKTDKTVTAFGNLANQRVPLQIGGQWLRATPEFQMSETLYEEMGMYAGGYAAVKENGRWGVCSTGGEPLVPSEYDAIAMDELGRCYGQGAVFVKQGSSWRLYRNGAAGADTYEDAKPFQDGYAAVKQNGKWGFVDAEGTLVLPCQWDDARSFGMHVAAVRSGDRWGYINRFGNLVIEPTFQDAKSFSSGYAPVQTDTGWTVIALKEMVD